MIMKEITDKDLTHLINYQYKLIGVDKTIEDAKADDDWLYTDTITTKQYDEFKKYTVNYLVKTLKFTKVYAERSVWMFLLNYSLKINDESWKT